MIKKSSINRSLEGKVYRKIDGYSKIFEIGVNKESRYSNLNGFKNRSKSLLKTKRGIADVPENYRKYWFDIFKEFSHKIS